MSFIPLSLTKKTLIILNERMRGNLEFYVDESQFAAAAKLTDIETSRDGADISNRHSDNKFS